ncbi:MAG: HNH endonuclease [Planctomycetota bacterium]|jgi:hypothetical protein
MSDEQKVFNVAFLGKACFYCGDHATSLDHINPKRYGGSDDESNLVPCCYKCNSEKRGRAFWEWFRDTLRDRRIYKNRIDQIGAIAKASVPNDRLAIELSTRNATSE